jgi:hypothetical protein
MKLFVRVADRGGRLKELGRCPVQRVLDTIRVLRSDRTARTMSRGRSCGPRLGPAGTLRHAVAEFFNGLYKTEVIPRRGPWRGLDDMEYATLDYVDWFKSPAPR